MKQYEVKVKAILRPSKDLTDDDAAKIVAEIATLLRTYNGGGGGKVIEVDIGVRERP